MFLHPFSVWDSSDIPFELTAQQRLLSTGDRMLTITQRALPGTTASFYTRAETFSRKTYKYKTLNSWDVSKWPELMFIPLFQLLVSKHPADTRRRVTGDHAGQQHAGAYHLRHSRRLHQELRFPLFSSFWDGRERSGLRLRLRLGWVSEAKQWPSKWQEWSILKTSKELMSDGQLFLTPKSNE